MSASISDYHWLTSDAATPHLQRCATFVGELHQLTAMLRKELSAQRAHLIIEQSELRQRAKEKFARAEEMFFTRKGYEQATDEGIAKYKASRVAAIAHPPVDLCCGIGGDLLALGALAATRGEQALGIDLDSITAHLAAINCERIVGSKAVKVEARDANEITLDELGLIHIDPDRRADGARHTRFADLMPGGAFLEQHAGRDIAMKLAPATEVPERWASLGEREWIGSGRECKQQVLWLGSAAHTPGRRTATLVSVQGAPLLHLIEDPNAKLETADKIGRYIHEPHPVVLAAGLTAELAQECGEPLPCPAAIKPDGGYLTGDHPICRPGIMCFAVQEDLPFDFKRLKAALRARGIGRLEIKKRGVSDDPEQLRKRLDLRGEEQATLILARNAKGTFAAIARRVK